MNGSLEIGHVAGVPLRLHWSAPLLVVVLSIGLAGSVLPAWAPGHSASAYRLWAVVGALLLTASLIAHEGGHALVARRFKIAVKDVTVFALGGVTRMASATTPRSQGLVAGVGPLISLVLGGLCLGGSVLARDVLHWPLPGGLLLWGGWTNILLAAFNLLPAAPLDGGRVLQALIWRIRGDRERAAQASGRCGQVTGAVFLAGGLFESLRGTGSGLWLGLIGLFVVVVASAEVRRAQLFASLRGLPVAEAMRPVFTGQEWQSVDRFLTETAGHAGDQPVIPVTDLDGRPSGYVTVPLLRAVPEVLRPSTRVRDVAAPLERCVLAGPEEKITEVLERAAMSPSAPVLVIDHHRLVGMVTGADLASARGRLPDPPERPPPDARAGHGH
ncbi:MULTISPECIES: site-2 protease family protein [unclassified Streptomyces]|uniref:site-2 protease family protein n=1 Tax=unclassified Streptomyces TaxID=2593676 RepID=UPI00099B48EF|nr:MULTISPECIES: site-2 protease family protein [unclassified Streptomyces]